MHMLASCSSYVCVCVPHRCDDDEDCCELDEGEAECCTESSGVAGYVLASNSEFATIL